MWWSEIFLFLFFRGDWNGNIANCRFYLGGDPKRDLATIFVGVIKMKDVFKVGMRRHGWAAHGVWTWCWEVGRAEFQGFSIQVERPDAMSAPWGPFFFFSFFAFSLFFIIFLRNRWTATCGCQFDPLLVPVASMIIDPSELGYDKLHVFPVAPNDSECCVALLGFAFIWGPRFWLFNRSILLIWFRGMWNFLFKAGPAENY